MAAAGGHPSICRLDLMLAWGLSEEACFPVKAEAGYAKLTR